MLANNYISKNFTTTDFTNIWSEYFLDNVSNTSKTYWVFSDVFYVKSNWWVALWRYNTFANTFTSFWTDTWFKTPEYWETKVFNDRLFYCSYSWRIASMYMWNTGQIQAIQWDWTTTITIVTDIAGNVAKQFTSAIVWWTLVLSNWSSYTISSVNVWSQTMVLSSTLASWTYYWYAYFQNINWVTKDDWTTTYMGLPKQWLHYKPMADFNSMLYIWDGDLICSLDSNLSKWGTTPGWVNPCISVWTWYTVKKIEQIGGYMYILADNISVYDYNNYSPTIWNNYNSKLYIWDWTSIGFNNIINIWTYCFDIKVIENKIYALLNSKKLDWSLFTYFNGSDFPTIAKIQLDNPKARVWCIAYDRWRFYFQIYWVSRTDATQWTRIFSYSAYANETPCVVNNYYNSSNNLENNFIEFINRWYSGTWAPKSELLSHWLTWTSNIYVRDEYGYLPSWTIQTQKYEITFDQFWKLVKWVQLNFKEIMNSACSVEVWYKWDESSTFVKLWTLTSTNQNDVLYGINERFKKIQFNIVLKTSNSIYTPKIVKISVY
jgi:hypothetical protein